MTTGRDRFVEGLAAIDEAGKRLNLTNKQIRHIKEKFGVFNPFDNQVLNRIEAEAHALNQIAQNQSQEARNKALGKRFSDPLFSGFREAVAVEKVRVAAGERRQRGFTGAIRGGRAFLAGVRDEDQNDRPFLGG